MHRRMCALDRTNAVKRTANALYYSGSDSLSDFETDLLTFDQEFNKLAMGYIKFLEKLDNITTKILRPISLIVFVISGISIVP
jgi:hypothetical protein